MGVAGPQQSKKNSKGDGLEMGIIPDPVTRSGFKSLCALKVRKEDRRADHDERMCIINHTSPRSKEVGKKW